MTENTDLIRLARELARLRKEATPGPWKVVDENGIQSVSENKSILVDFPCEGLHWNGSYDDVYLAAAAPEMAELLEKMADALEKRL